ncbi:hypothetical protein F2Q70_00045530 [Brassica cretica]|uniref:C2H2-type domain-containing protein n=1 Tax=Brassica cretica TaxID=69181 RepID=A0A8S9KDY9_BRACR|nr:hypothetical protein F2Q70_00045530 [Brassica cretica]
MSSSHNNSTSSSSTQSSLPAGATTGANNLNRQETATTSTQLPNSVADPLVDEYICEVCGKKFKREQTRDLHMRGHNLPFTVPRRRN